MREILTRYGRHNIGFLWLFVEPILFTLGVTGLWTLAGMSHHSSIPIVAFAVTGYSSVLLWRNMPSRCTSAVEPNLSLMYHRNVKLIDIFLSRILLEFLGATASFFFLSIFFISIGWMSPPNDILKVAIGWFLLTWFGAALGLLMGSMSSRSDLVEKLWHPVSYILFPLSGAAYMVAWLPLTAQQGVMLLPMVHGVEIVRNGYFGTTIEAHYDYFYLIAWCLCLTLLGLAQERIASRMVVPE